MPKQIIYGEEARNKLKAGVDKLARAVVTTLGLKGRNVAIGKGWLDPQVVHDGVTVAREVILSDPFENIGAQIVRQAASKTNDNVGDGTTTATLLAQAIVERALSAVNSGANAMMVRRGLEKALALVEKEILKLSTPISTYEQKRQVATISAQNEEIGSLVADAIEKVGDQGVVTYTESKGFDLELEFKEGTRIPSGFASPYFINNKSNESAEIENAVVLVLDTKMTSISDALLALRRLIEKVKGLKIVIIGDVEGDALLTVLQNMARGMFQPLVIKPPFLGTRRKMALEDIATITGASVISAELGRDFESITNEDLGTVERVVATRGETILVGGGGNKELIEQRVKELKKQLKDLSGLEKERMQERIATFSGGVAVIKVGASTEGEMIEKKLRVEDAINATKSAIEMGIVPGGGIALLHARNALKGIELTGDEAIGGQILYDALDKPLRKIVENAGADSGEVIGKVKTKKGLGLNILTMEYGDMVKMGVADPTKVTISALKNAVSVAILVMTTDCIIVEEELKEKI